jgi:hypothetical protein
MTKLPHVAVERVLPRTGPGTLTAAEVQAILLVAFLATEADAKVSGEEESSFRNLAKALRALAPAGDPGLANAKLDELIGKTAGDVDRTGRPAVLAKIASALATPLARELAYKVAIGMSLVDLEKSDEEDDFDSEVIQALGLSEEQADTLAGDVYAALEDEE